MSRILVDQIRSNSASGDAITLDGSGKCAINATTINSLTFPTSDGSANQLLKTNGSGALSFIDSAAGGKLLQVVQTSDFGNLLYSTSTSYVNTGLSLNITTGSAASKLLVIANPQVGARGASGQDAYMNVGLAKDNTIVRHGFSGAWMGNTSSISNYNVYEVSTLIYLDSSVSTSTTYNYKIQIKKISSTTQAQYNPHQYESNGGSWMTILEIAT